MEKLKSTGNVRITGRLNHASGEYVFEVSAEDGTRSVKNKCLFDALSEYGISYDKAKDLIQQYHQKFSSTVLFKTFPHDYFKNTPMLRSQHD